MKNKIITIVSVTVLSGCAQMFFPGWDKVVIEQSVYKKPCRFITTDPFIGSREPNEYFKMHAISVGANTFVRKGLNASFFYCAQGLPPYIDDEHTLRFVRNKFDKSATKIDYEKALAECEYQSHAATVDTSRPNPSRIFIPTNSYSLNSAQMSAIERDSIAEDMRKINLSTTQMTLLNECVAAKGYVYSNTEKDDKSLAELRKNCPGSPEFDNLPCFIPVDPN